MENVGRRSARQDKEQPSALQGQVVYVYAFDLAYDTKRVSIPTILGHPTHSYDSGPGKPVPRHGFFYRPQMVTLPVSRRESSFGSIEVAEAVKLFNVGAISVQIRIPFEVSDIEGLVGYHHLKLDDKPIEVEAMELAERVRRELTPYFVRPVTDLLPGEDYTVFCVHQLPGVGSSTAARSEDWLMRHRRAVAGLLTQEQDAAQLSEQEAAESTERYLSYYERDLVVVDWDAALVIGERDSLEEVIHVVELANVQLAELGAYDRVLDSALELAYRDLARTRLGRRSIRRNLREIRVDMARLNDELQNITKFFGDWHLAKIYQNLSGRFHLGDWHGIINVKLRTLADLYQLLYQDWINSWMVILEVTIVLLFILDVILLLLGL